MLQSVLIILTNTGLREAVYMIVNRASSWSRRSTTRRSLIAVTHQVVPGPHPFAVVGDEPLAAQARSLAINSRRTP